MTGGCAHREKGIYNTAACEFNVHPNQIRLGRNHLTEQLPKLISNRRPQQEKAREELEAELFLRIGQLKMEIEGLKKITYAPVTMKRAKVEKEMVVISIVRRSIINQG